MTASCFTSKLCATPAKPCYPVASAAHYKQHKVLTGFYRLQIMILFQKSKQVNRMASRVAWQKGPMQDYFNASSVASWMLQCSSKLEPRAGHF